MEVEFGTPRLQLLIMAIQDAIRMAQSDLNRMPEEDQPDQQLYLMDLGNLQADLKRAYERRVADGERLMPYDLVAGNKTFRKV